MRAALGQINAVVGDLAGNLKKMQGFYTKALQEGADLILFPELAVCGYPPEDLLLKRHFLDDNLAAVKKLAAACPEKTLIAGFAEKAKAGIYNSAAVLQKGRIQKIYRKGLLPNYGVFDEKRYFQGGSKPLVIDVAGQKVAVTICKDIWDIKWLGRFLGRSKRFDLLVNISASPFYVGKTKERYAVLRQAAKRFNSAVVYCNLVGGQDELVFDGRSMALDSKGRLAAQAKPFEEDLFIVDIGPGKHKTVAVTPTQPPVSQLEDTVEEAYHALVLGTRDYFCKNGFKKALLGLSGGIDSSLVAAIAAEALGAENITGITMPSRFNSSETIGDAERLAKNLGIGFVTIPIGPVLEQFDGSLGAHPKWDNKGTAYENLQARIRGTILMSLSNQLGAVVLTTGNKSETAVGYATLYGDTAGGFAVIKDIFKTLVYKMAGYINKKSGREIIPESVIKRIPTAELRPNQKDTDSLPDYDILDEILTGYVEEDKSAKELIAKGLPKDAVYKVIRMVDSNEYKRRQSPPGVKITPKAFGKDRRLPITNRYTPLEGL